MLNEGSRSRCVIMGRMTAIRVLALALPGLLLLGGCVGQPPTIDPSGVDGLQIPLVSPDPSDFVERIDNPWFPLEPGTVWTYATGARGSGTTLVVTVTDRTRVLAGVRTIEVHEVETDTAGRVVEEGRDWFAQDTSGNVWRFGEETSSTDPVSAALDADWQAGVAGAQAGLMMPATPRLGDGYREAYLPGTVEDQVTVLSLTQQRTVEAGTFEDLLLIQEESPLATGLVEHSYYAVGLGLVHQEPIAGAGDRVSLVDVVRP